MLDMPKPKIPESGVLLGRSGEIARFESAAQLDFILASTKLRLVLLGAFAFLVLGCWWLGRKIRIRLIRRRVAYILLTKHYAAGDFILAVSSYWSPLLSRLLALGLRVGWSGLNAPAEGRLPNWEYPARLEYVFGRADGICWERISGAHAVGQHWRSHCRGWHVDGKPDGIVCGLSAQRALVWRFAGCLRDGLFGKRRGDCCCSASTQSERRNEVELGKVF